MNYSLMEKLMIAVMLILVTGVVLVTLVALCSLPFSYVKEAELINEKYNTEYSAWDMFLAGDTIKGNLVGTKHNIDLE